uniref:Uncharacterized protein n=1 Tax=Globisporangium ultimum (strain ATCC 200006 / CBS 805.95 / DAOM BR144) TaxID=431595 RepID=K3X3U2_GLOUD
MGTFALFSPDYCATKSTCVLIDAWLQLFLCIVTVVMLVVLCDALTGCCSCRRWKSDEADDSYSEGSMIRRVLGKARYPASRRRLWNNTDSKTLPLPQSVIKKDARSAQIMSHKNSHKHGAHFMKQTQRVSRGGFAAMQLGRKNATTQPANESDMSSAVEGSFLGPTRTEVSRQGSGNGAGKKLVI